MPDSSDPMDCSLPGFSVHGIFQAKVLEWGAIAFSAAPCLMQAGSPAGRAGLGSGLGASSFEAGISQDSRKGQPQAQGGLPAAPPPGSPPWGAPAPQLRVSCEEIGSPPCLQSSLAPASWGAAGALLHEGRKRGIQAASVAASCRPGSGAAGRPRAPEQDCADLPRPSHLPSSSPLAHLTSPRVCGSPLGCSILLHP